MRWDCITKTYKSSIATINEVTVSEFKNSNSFGLESMIIIKFDNSLYIFHAIFFIYHRGWVMVSCNRTGLLSTCLKTHFTFLPVFAGEDKLLGRLPKKKIINVSFFMNLYGFPFPANHFTICDVVCLVNLLTSHNRHLYS